jgi:SAM-dependent methyltransferase
MSNPDPSLIQRTLMAFEQTQALKAACELDLFTAIAAGAATASDIAARIQASERGTRILCDFLVVHEFLTKTGDRYGLTPTAATFLDSRLPTYLGGMAKFLAHQTITSTFDNLAATVRHGGAIGASTVDPDNPVWVEFARSMGGFLGAVAATLAPHVATAGVPQKVLDIAAGHGRFGIEVARLNEEAHVYAVDWKNVLSVARENAEKFGVAARFHEIPGSAFEVPLGTDYDLILIPNFLHHFDVPTCVAFLKRVKAALKATGVVATSEFVPNPDRVSPPMPAAFSLQMLAGTPRGDAYTFAEFDAMFREAGFAPSTAVPLTPTPQTLILSRIG